MKNLKILRSFIFILIITGLILTACGGDQAQDKTYTIGLVTHAPPLNESIELFKTSMAELGYIEGENVAYIYHGVTAPQAIDDEIESLLAQDVDLLFTAGNVSTLAAKKAVEGTDIPVIASPMGSGNPVEEGIVESLTQPGGNVTGVCCGNFMPKALDWLFTLMPGTTMMYVPYYPDSRSSAPTLAQLPEVAASLGVELVLDEVSSPEEEVATIKALPDDAVVYIVPRVDDVSHIVQAATERGLAVGAVNDERALVNLISDLGAMSKQAARLADQILQGTAPADLPVERAEAFLRINLKTAEAMGLDVPDEILQQADTIIR